MTIAAVCPHCDAEFSLSPDLLGKAMRCPECREVFEVRPVAAEAPPPPVPVSAPAPSKPEPAGYATGSVGEFVPVLEVEAAPEPEASSPFERVEAASHGPLEVVVEPADKDLPFELPSEELPAPPVPPPPPKKSKPAAPVPVAAFARGGPKAEKPAPAAPKEVTWHDGAGALPAGPKEVTWHDGAAPLPAGEPAPEPEPASAAADDLSYRRRPKRNPWPTRIFVLLLLTLVGVVGVTGFNYLRFVAKSEERDAAEAEAAYTGGKYPVAVKKYEDLIGGYPKSAALDKYRFMLALAETRGAVDDPGTRENPAPARDKLAEFVTKNGNSSLALPGAGFGADIVAAGRKLADTTAEHAGDFLKKFQADRAPAKADLLGSAEKAAQDGLAALPQFERFRDKEGAGFDDQRKKFADVLDAVRREHDRLAVLAPFRDLDADPTDDKIEEFAVTLKRSGLEKDPEAASMVERAKAKLRELIGSVRDGLPPAPPPVDQHPPVLFAPPLAGGFVPRSAADAPNDVAFAVARGILYALDGQTGNLLWGARVGDPAGDPRAADRLPVRFAANVGADLLIVPSEAGGRPGVYGRSARTGEVLWYQPLEARLAGRPVVVGRRVYVPLADPLGTFVEIQAGTGLRVGHTVLRQPIGAGLAAMPGEQPGSGYLFVPADARRVFVFEVGREADDGTRLPPKCVRVIPTDHPKDSVRVEPLLVASPLGVGPRYFILPQGDGPTAMKLRVFPLPTAAELAAAGGNAAALPDAVPTAPTAEVTVPGWSWFPPATDGERVVAATDSGAVAVFGVNQTGNEDRPLFPLPAPAGGADPDAVNRSLVAAVDEESAWVVAGGQLARLRTAVDPLNGFRVVRDGAARAVGEPVHRASVLPALGLGVVVTRLSGAGGFRATAFDLGSGLVRWQRQLGATLTAPPVVRDGKPAVVGDESGGVYLVPLTDGEPGPAEVLAPPSAEPAAKAQVARSADGSVVWSVVPEATPAGRRLRARCVVDGVLKSDAVIPVSEFPAGAPAVLGQTAVVPLANGALVRLAPGGKEPTPGPVWRSGRARPDAVAFLVPVGPDDFLASDGDTQVARWQWPAGGDPTKLGGPWESRDPFVLPPALVGAGPGARFATADAGGAVRLFDLAKPVDHVGLWRGGEGTAIPVGEPGAKLDAPAVDGKPRVVFAANRRHLVALDPDAQEPLWDAAVVPPDGPELLGWADRDGKLVATDMTGRVAVYDLATGALLGDTPPAPGGLATAAAVPVGGRRALLALADGTLVAVVLPR